METGFFARGEFLTEPAVVAHLMKTSANGFVVEFLGVIQFVTTGNAGGVKVGNTVVMFADGGNDITFHDLHVIDIVK